MQYVSEPRAESLFVKNAKHTHTFQYDTSSAFCRALYACHRGVSWRRDRVRHGRDNSFTSARAGGTALLYTASASASATPSATPSATTAPATAAGTDMFALGEPVLASVRRRFFDALVDGRRGDECVHQ